MWVGNLREECAMKSVTVVQEDVTIHFLNIVAT
jgi:hypothetical protein